MLFDTYSKRRRRRERRGQQDPYQYDHLPKEFRVQVIHIWASALGIFESPGLGGFYGDKPLSNTLWEKIESALARELGVFSLGRTLADPFERCQEFLQKADTDQALDLIELSFAFAERVLGNCLPAHLHARGIEQTTADAILELNARFREHAIGYQYVNGEIVRVDSQYLHAEVVRPSLTLLSDQGFEGASEEFLKAHRHYRLGEHKEALVAALRSFESTLKTICKRQGWPCPANATASRLIQVVLQNGLVPEYLEGELHALRSLMESALPTTRNREGGHGQGESVVPVPEYIAAFGLHSAAANILLLVRAHIGLKKGRRA